MAPYDWLAWDCHQVCIATALYPLIINTEERLAVTPEPMKVPNKIQDLCKVQSHEKEKKTGLELNLDAGFCVGRAPRTWKGSKVSAVAKTL